MQSPTRRQFELNELNWWSRWTTLSWEGRDSYLLSSQEFPEVFFNKGGFLSCRTSPRIISKHEEVLRTARVRPAFMIYDDCARLLNALSLRGYMHEDTMTVMVGDGQAGPGSRVEVRESGSSAAWTRAYLMAFYGEVGLSELVQKVVGRLMEDASTSLLEAKVGPTVAGVTATFRTRGILGVYCVGTVPEHRRAGVAGALLDRAKELARAEGRTIFLQTLQSEGVVPFYTKRGFRVAYRKALMAKKR